MRKPTEGFEDSMEFHYDYLSSASTQDCTGLIPRKPPERDAMENYAALYPFLTGSPEEMLDDELI